MSQPCKMNETRLVWPDATSIARGGGLIREQVGLGAGGVAYVNLNSRTNVEAATQYPLPRDGEFVSFAVNPFKNTLGGGEAILTVRVNGASTSLQILVSAGSTAVQTLTLTPPLEVFAGDLISFQIDTTSAVGGGEIIFEASYEYVVNEN